MRGFGGVLESGILAAMEAEKTIVVEVEPAIATSVATSVTEMVDVEAEVAHVAEMVGRECRKCLREVCDRVWAEWSELQCHHTSCQDGTARCGR